MNAEFVEAEVAVARAIAGRARRAAAPSIAQAMYWRSEPVAALQAATASPPTATSRPLSARSPSWSRSRNGRRFGVPDPEPQASAVTGEGYLESRELLAAAGIAFSPARRAGSVEEAVAAARELEGPRRDQGARASAQVRRRRRRPRTGRRRRGCRGRAGPGGPARAGGLLGRGDGRHRRRSRAHRRLPSRPSVRAARPASASAASMQSCCATPAGCAGTRLGGRAGAASAPAPRCRRSSRGARGRPPVDVRAAAEAAAALSRVRGRAPGGRRDQDQPAARARVGRDRPRRTDRA